MNSPKILQGFSRGAAPPSDEKPLREPTRLPCGKIPLHRRKEDPYGFVFPPFREVSTFTRPGARWNEDAVGGRRTLSLRPRRGHQPGRRPVMDPVSDAAWLVRETARWLDRHLPEASCPPGGHPCPGDGPAAGPVERSPGRPPSAGVAIFRRGEGVEYFGLGDCAASLQLTDGTFRTWEETALSALDGQALEEACALAQARGCSLRESLPGIQGPPPPPPGLPGNTQGATGSWTPPGWGSPTPAWRRSPSQCRFSLPVHRWAGPVRGLRPGGGRGRPPSPGGRGGDGPLADRLGPARRPTQTWRPAPLQRRDDATGALCHGWVTVGHRNHGPLERARPVPFGTGLASCCVVMGRRGLGSPAGLPPGADELHHLAVLRHLLELHFGVAEMARSSER